MRINSGIPTSTMSYQGANRQRIKFLEFRVQNRFALSVVDLGMLKNSTILLWLPRAAIAAVELPRFSECRETYGGFQVAVGSDGFELLLRPGAHIPTVAIRDNKTGKSEDPKKGRVVIGGAMQSALLAGQPFDLLSPDPIPNRLLEKLMHDLGAHIATYRDKYPLLDGPPSGITAVYYGIERPEGMNELEIYVCPDGGKKLRLPDNLAFREKVRGESSR